MKRPPHRPATRLLRTRPAAAALPTSQPTTQPPPAQAAAAAAAAAAPLLTSTTTTQADTMVAYAELKIRISRRARKAGAGLAAYLLLTVSGEAAAAALLGTAAGAAYLALLYRDTDALNTDSPVPLMAAQAEASPFARRVKVLGAAYWHALANPRLGVVVALGAAVGAGTAASGRAADPPLLEAGCLLLGFLSYKIALLLELWDDLKPKVDPEAGLRGVRPSIPDLPSVARWDEVEKEEIGVGDPVASEGGGGVGGLFRKVLPPKQP